MAQINDAKKETLANLGYVYTAVDDAYKAYLQTESGLTEGTIQDLEKYLFEFLGYSGTLQSMWFEFLRDNGYTNTLQDMLHAFWNSDSAGLSPLYFSDFYAPLTHTAVPERAAAGTTSTFTRATTSTWKNNDGYMVTGVAGEIGFVGARRVRNLFVTTTADMSNAAWTKSNISVTTGQLDPDGGTTAMKLVESSGASVIPQISQTGNCVAGNRTIMWIVAKAAERSWLVVNNNQGSGGGSIRVWFNLAAGTVGTVTAGGTADITSLGDGWYLCAVSAVIANGSDCAHVYQVTNANGVNTYAGDGTSGIYVWHPQLEDVTAQTTQTAGEYVSVGVPGDWAGTDLVTNGTFDTDTGWLKEVAEITIAGGAAVFTACASDMSLYQTSFGFSPSTTYVCTFDIQTIGAGGIYLNCASVVVSGVFTTTGTKTVTFTTAVSLVNDNFNLISSGAATTCTVDNVVCKPAYYHGSMVDGVKCFDTDIAGNAIPSTTLLGYVAEGARTNLCLQSQTFDNASWTNTNVTVTANAVAAPDGTTTADLLYPASSGTDADRRTLQAVTSTATAHTVSFYLKYAGFRWIMVSNTDAGAANDKNWFDVQNGVVGTIGAGTTSMSAVSVGNGWYRVSVTATNASTNCYAWISCVDGDGSSTVTASGTNGVYAWGAQVELGSFASSYIPTTTIAVARNTDVLTYTGGDIANIMTLYAGFRRDSGVNTNGAIVSLNDGTLDQRTQIVVGITDVTFAGIAGGVSQWNILASNEYATGTTGKVAASAATNDVKFSLNGVAQTIDTSATEPAVTQLEVGTVTGLIPLYGNVGPIYGWTRNLSQSELNAVTA